VSSTPRITVNDARRFVRCIQKIDTPFAGIAPALRYFGYVQIDPLNVCGRMHDLILRQRVQPYREGDLLRHVHGESLDAVDVAVSGSSSAASPGFLSSESRLAFEHHLPDSNVLVVFPLDAWPHLRAAMRARARRTSAWSGRLTPTERRLAPKLLAEIAARGPLSSEDFADTSPARRPVWGRSTVVKTTLQKLFFHGELLIAGRSKHRRRYDLPERVVPAKTLAEPAPDRAATARWLALLKLRQRRLSTLKRDELHAITDCVQAIFVAGCPTLYCLRDDLPLLESGSAMDPRVRLLAPLDPLIYDRKVTAALWDFDYTWEAYVPPAKRRRGHYALPVLDGLEFAGHVEPKADRVRGKLVIASRSIRRGTRVAPALDELAAWLGLSR